VRKYLDSIYQSVFTAPPSTAATTTAAATTATASSTSTPAKPSAASAPLTPLQIAQAERQRLVMTGCIASSASYGGAALTYGEIDDLSLVGLLCVALPHVTALATCAQPTFVYVRLFWLRPLQGRAFPEAPVCVVTGIWAVVLGG
jgi:hypothetical protein